MFVGLQGRLAIPLEIPSSPLRSIPLVTLAQPQVNEHQSGPTSKHSMQAMPCPQCGEGLKLLGMRCLFVSGGWLGRFKDANMVGFLTWFILEDPMNKWMIWGENPPFKETPKYDANAGG